MSSPAPAAPPSLPAPRPGRPRTATDKARRQQAIDAAEHLFKANGFIGSTMSDVARLAGMSKKTIYTVFDSKDALLGAVLERHFQPLSAPLEPDDGRPLAETLSRLLLQALSFILAAEEVQFLRLMLADEAHASQVRSMLEQLGFLHQRSTIGAWMTRQAELGAIEIDDPAVAAEMLVGMALGEMHIRSLLGAMDTPPPAVLAERATLAVQMFLNGALQRE